MQKKPRRPWYQVVVAFTTRAGKPAETRSKPIEDRAEAGRVERQYEQTGHKTRVVEIPAPRKKPTRLALVDMTVGMLPGLGEDTERDTLRGARNRRR